MNKIALLKSVESFDDDRGIIGLLIRVAENMSNKLKADNVDTNLLCQGYQHQNYLKRQNSCSYMEDNAFLLVIISERDSFSPNKNSSLCPL